MFRKLQHGRLRLVADIATFSVSRSYGSMFGHGMPRARDDVESGREGPSKGARDVANLEDRVTNLEGRADNHTRAVDGLRIEIANLRAEVATRSDVTDLRNEMSRRFEVMDAKIDRHFVWLAGMMVTGFITVIGALVGVVYR